MDINKKLSVEIVNFIRSRRLELGLKQSELAVKADISPVTYGHIESGRRELKIYELSILSAILNIDANSITKSAISKLKTGEGSLDKTYKNKVVAFTSFKGGTGVSTLAVLLANEIAQHYKVLFIDAHYQASCYHMREIDRSVFPEVRPLYEVKKVPVNKLTNYIAAQCGDYDYIIIDLPRFFYVSEYIDNVLLRSNFVFVPFHLSYHFSTTDNYIKHAAGRFDLFIELQAKIKQQENVHFTLIPFRDDISQIFKEWIEDKEIALVPCSFKYHEEISRIDTFNPLPSELHAPYIQDTRNVLYHLMNILSAHPIIEDQKKYSKASWDVMLESINDKAYL